jgi:hypothetical protein
VTMSETTEGRGLGGFKNLLSVVRENAGPEILGHGNPM